MPNKKNKNQPKNSFYFYMLSLKPQLQRQGVVLENGLQSLAEIAGPRWKDLPEHEKEVYQEMARQAKANRQYGQPRNDRRDCTGQFLSQRVDAVSLNENKRRRQRDEVKSTWPPGKLVCDERFYLIGFMSLCPASDEVQLPCELGVAEFSINGGIIKTMHRFIKPGDIPLGHRFQCTSTSETTHKIPLSGLAKEGDTYYNIFMDLLGFVNPEGNHAFPPLYSRASETRQTEHCLDWLAMSAGMPNRVKKVYELEGLICDLYEHATKGQGQKISKPQATELISSTMFDYELGSRCKWHETEEVKFCALGTVKRSCYCIADFLCPHYNVTLTTKHMPERPEGTFGTVLNDTSDSSSKRNAQFDDDELTYPAYTQRPAFGRGHGYDETTYNRSGPTYEGSSLSSESSNATTSWHQRSLNEQVPVNQQTLFSEAISKTTASRFPIGRGRGRGRGVPSANRPGLPGEPTSVSTSSGRGRGVRIPNTKPKVFAGSASAPHPSNAPPPPLAWQQPPQQYQQPQPPQQYQQPQPPQQYQQPQPPQQYQHPQQYQQPQQQQYFQGYEQTNQSPWQQGQRASNSSVYGMNTIDEVMKMMSNTNLVSNQ